MAARDLPRSVRLLLERVNGRPSLAFGVLDRERLDQASFALGDAGEAVGLWPIDGLVAIADHGHEAFGILEERLQLGRGKGEGGRSLIASKRIDLPFDHGAAFGAIAFRKGEGRDRKERRACKGKGRRQDAKDQCMDAHVLLHEEPYHGARARRSYGAPGVRRASMMLDG